MSKTALLVLCGPSGSGKSTLLKKLFAEYPNSFGFSVSHTTRSPRSGEVDGKDYHFVSKEEMLDKIDKKLFIEHAVFSGNHYGTSKSSVESVLNSKICVLDIDVQGVKQLKSIEEFPNKKLVFVEPPSIGALKERLEGRGTENLQSLSKRLAAAESEIAYGTTPGNFDLVLLNDDIEESYRKLREFILPEVLKLNASGDH